VSRSGYVDDEYENWDLIRWRGAVASAFRGKRGQAFLCETLAALEAMPEKRLLGDTLVADDGGCCTMGAVAKARGCDVSEVDPEDREQVADVFGIAEAMAAEIAFMNDEGWYDETPEQRYMRMLTWVRKQIRQPTTPPAGGEANE